MTTNTTAPVPASDGNQHLAQLLQTHQRVTSEIYAALRVRLAKEESLHMSPPPQAYTNRVRQLQKAFELFRQAEAKVELLILYFSRHGAQAAR